MLPSLDNLRCFVEAARLLNFRAAARVVALTPAAFGQRVRQLEAQVGRPLFQRTTRSVALTEAGLALLPSARQTLHAAGECLRAARGDAAPAQVELTLGTRHELGMSWLLPALAPLRAAHAWLQPHLYFGSGADLLIRVRSLECDCVIGSMRVTDPKLDAVRLHREDYVFVAARSLLREQPLAQPRDAAAHTLIDTHPELPLFNYWRQSPRGGDRLRFGRILRMGTVAAIRELVLAGVGVAVLPAYLVRPDIERGALRVVFPAVRPVHDYFRLIYRADDARLPLYQSLARTLLRLPLA